MELGLWLSQYASYAIGPYTGNILGISVYQRHLSECRDFLRFYAIVSMAQKCALRFGSSIKSSNSKYFDPAKGRPNERGSLLQGDSRSEIAA